MLCDAENSCLLLIDIQEKLSAAMPDKVISRLRRNVGILIESANTLNVPVITTAQYPRGLGSVETFISDSVHENTATFEKTCFSCLGADGFTAHLSSLARKQVIVAGIEAHICVFQTATDLHKAGYEVFVVNDAIASRTLSSYESAIQRLQTVSIQSLTTEAVLFEWLRDASHNDFRTLSKLIA